MNKNQKGFMPLQIILMIIIVGLIGFTGWYVYDNNNDKNASKTSQEEQKNISNEEDLTKDWTSYSNKEGQFSLKHPSTWATALNPQYCSEGLFLIGANASSVGNCGSEGFGQMAVISNTETLPDNGELNPVNYPDIKTESVTVNDVVGKRQTGTYKVTSEGIGPADGDKIVLYVFHTNGRTYTASYNINSNYPDVLNDFDLMITKTLKFQP